VATGVIAVCMLLVLVMMRLQRHLPSHVE